MKTTKKSANKLNKVSTFLPVFNGFYSTIWEYKTEVDMELEYLNEDRGEKKEITHDDLIIDYKQAHTDLAKKIFFVICRELEQMELIKSGTFESLNSPREYNFYNDSIHCSFELSKANERTINKYIAENFEAFKTHIKDHYTSRSGFSSFYSGNVDTWLAESGEPLKHEHKLSAVLNFILLNEGLDNDYFFDKVEFYMGEYVTVSETNEA